MKKETETLLLITWRDSRMYLEPTEREDKYSICTIQTVGFLISETDEQVVIARDVHDEENCRGVIVIPRENVISQIKLYTGEVDV